MASIDISRTKYHEKRGLRADFSEEELRHLRLLLRRLRFLEARVAESGGLQNGGSSGGAAFAEWEASALEYVLNDMEFLEIREPRS